MVRCLYSATAKYSPSDRIAPASYYLSPFYCFLPVEHSVHIPGFHFDVFKSVKKVAPPVEEEPAEDDGWDFSAGTTKTKKKSRKGALMNKWGASAEEQERQEMCRHLDPRTPARRAHPRA